jgi:hypothetical protein
MTNITEISLPPSVVEDNIDIFLDIDVFIHLTE